MFHKMMYYNIVYVGLQTEEGLHNHTSATEEYCCGLLEDDI